MRKVGKTPRSVIPPLIPIIMLSLVCASFLDRYLLSMPEKEGKRAVNDEYISQGSDGTRSYHNMNRIQSVFGYQVPCYIEGLWIFGILLRHGSFDSHPRL